MEDASPPPHNFRKNIKLTKYPADRTPPTHIVALKMKQACYQCGTLGHYESLHYASPVLADLAKYLIETVDASGDRLRAGGAFLSFVHLLEAYSPHQKIGTCQCGHQGAAISSEGLHHLSTAIFRGRADDAAFDYFQIRAWPMTIYEHGEPAYIPGDDQPGVVGTRAGMNYPGKLPFSLSVCGLTDLFKELQRSGRPSFLIRVSDPGTELLDFPPTVLTLDLKFYDVDDEQEIQRRNIQRDEVPNRAHVKAVLDFVDDIPPFFGHSLLIYGAARASRAPAALAAIIIARTMKGTENMAIDVVKKEIRPVASPNRLLLQAGDDLLGCNSRLRRSVDF